MKRVFTPVKKKMVLIVDDDPLAAGAYRKKLQRRGFQVEIAETGATAMLNLLQNGTGLVVLDLNLPSTNGLEVLKDIREKFPALPVGVFVNPYLTSLCRAANEEGAAICLTKGDGDSTTLLKFVCERLAPGQHEFQVETAAVDDLITPLMSKAPDVLTKLRSSHQIFARTADEESRRLELRTMHQQLRLLGAAGLAGFDKISRMNSAFEALLLELQAKPKKITPSVVRTVAQAIDSLASLLEQITTVTDDAETVPPKIFVVDDEVISRETVCAALERAGLSGTSMSDSVAAQTALEQEPFDLIFLDVEMPGMTGFELCSKIREMSSNKTTPVVFVTAHSDFASRAQSALSGGNDFITKPFLAGELAVKALSCLFKEKRSAAKPVPPNIIPAPPELAYDAAASPSLLPS